MNKASGKLIGLHQAFWNYDPWYRRAWYVWPQALSLTALIFVLAPGSASPPAAPWVKPLPPPPPQSADHQLCMNAAADFVQRGQACDRLIKLGQLTGPELAEAYFGRAYMEHRTNLIDPAVEDYTEVLKHNPRSYTAYINRGVLHMAKNNLDAALRDLDSSIKI